MPDAADKLFARLDAPKPPKHLMADGAWLTDERVPVSEAPPDRRQDGPVPFHTEDQRRAARGRGLKSMLKGKNGR